MKTNARTISKPFLILLAFEALFFLVLLSQSRMVKGHDAFIHFSLQYYFLNHVTQSGDIPLWVPYMTHGTLAAWWYAMQDGFLHNVLLYTGDLLRGFNFLTLYDLEMLADELILGVGVWLLSRRLFKSPLTALFAGLTVMGSCIWMTQPWFNFHFYYCLPLILYFGHRFLDTSRWRYAFAAANLLLFQILGNLPYFLSVISLIVFLYFLLYGLFYPRTIKRTVRRLNPLKTGGFVLLLGLNLALAYGTIACGTNEIINYNHLRDIHSMVHLPAFLHYGGNQNLSRWLEIVLGVSPAEDYTLYLGILSLPLIILGLLNLKRRHWHIACLIVVLFFISQGTLLAALFYYVWPMMKFYRHLSLLSCFIKLFLCFLAAAGFEALMFNQVRRDKIRKAVMIGSAVIFVGLAAWLFYLSGDYQRAVGTVSSIMQGMVPVGLYEGGIGAKEPYIRYALSPEAMALRLVKSALLCLMAAGFLGWALKPKGHLRFILMAVLAVQGIDLMHYKIAEMQMRTTVLTQDHKALTAFKPMEYAPQRNLYFKRNPEAELLWHTVPFLGVLHWTLNAFLMEDDLGHPYRTDDWLKPLDALVRSLNGQPIGDLSVLPRGLLPYLEWQFPIVNAGGLKITGVSEDKIQFFSHVYPSGDEEAIGRRLADKSYTGDQLFVSAPVKENWPAGGESDRLKLPYRIAGFSANELDIIVQSAPKGAWLMYSDTWHPSWRAAVNENRVPVFRADLAYKAVPLQPGNNLVKFYFRDPTQSLIYNFFGLNALVWLIVVGYLMARITRNTL